MKAILMVNLDFPQYREIRAYRLSAENWLRFENIWNFQKSFDFRKLWQKVISQKILYTFLGVFFIFFFAKNAWLEAPGSAYWIEQICSGFHKNIVVGLSICHTILIRRALESSDPGASNNGSNVEIRHFRTDIAAYEPAGAHGPVICMGYSDGF